MACDARTMFQMKSSAIFVVSGPNITHLKFNCYLSTTEEFWQKLEFPQHFSVSYFLRLC